MIPAVKLETRGKARDARSLIRGLFQKKSGDSLGLFQKKSGDARVGLRSSVGYWGGRGGRTPQVPPAKPTQAAEKPQPRVPTHAEGAEVSRDTSGGGGKDSVKKLALGALNRADARRLQTFANWNYGKNT